ncbi:hypothetical protein KJ784_02645 [Patescibacteria group bacterium]|nr:hypothetical protein [Patescibacteria group bacterium]
MDGSFEILRGRDFGQVVAILNKVCGGDKEKLDALLRDELEVKLVERILKLVDKNGRVIPAKDLKSAVCDANKDFYLVKPSLKTAADYANRLVRFQKAFKTGPVMSAAEFEGRSEELVSEIGNQKNFANLLNGVNFPVILPKLDSFKDYGRILEETFLPAAKFAYEKQFPGRRFYNYRENDLAGKVSVIPGARHEKLLERTAREFVVAIYFPNSLQGFSVLASREQMAALPESLLLAGGFDTAAAIAMYPDLLTRGWYTPGLDTAALMWQSPDYSLSFKADDDRLYFVNRFDLGEALGHFSSGLLFLGSA